MTILLTGAAGFIGFHTAKELLERGETVIGVDNLNDYYDVGLKQARLVQLQQHKNFTFLQHNIADREAMPLLAERYKNISVIIHLAAQAGVRYSLQNPYAYVEANVLGQVVMLELARLCPRLKHFVYASSSSVYGANTKMPFAIDDPVNDPVSLYAATKRSAELIASTYSRLYDLPTTGLRFFTVYGPWGRPDMAYFSFVKAAYEQTPIQVFNNGAMKRDFTYIDDIVAGIVALLDHPAQGAQLYNLGNNRPVALGDFLSAIETTTGKTLIKTFVPMQKGDVAETYADIDASAQDFGFSPKIAIDEGIPAFVAWYKAYYRVDSN